MQAYLKTLLIIICCTFSAGHLLADMPYMPIKFSLHTTQQSYWEGDRIDFILTIQNTDKDMTYPILTPGQNSGNKIVYLRVYDPAGNLFVLRAEENRQILMTIKHIGINGLVQLGPGQQLEIPFSWNDSVNYTNEVSAHHAFNKPIFSGLFNFQAIYNPFGTVAGDTLYHYMSNTEEQQLASKLNFIGACMSDPCLVKIKKKKAGRVRIDGIQYNCLGSDERGQYTYYLGDSAPKNMVHISSASSGSTLVILDWIKLANGDIEWIQRYKSGNIADYMLMRESKCPDAYYRRCFTQRDENMGWEHWNLVEQTDTLANGSTIRIIYNQDSTKMYEELYDKPTHIHTSKKYIYKNGRLHNVKKQSETYKEPCEDIIEIVNKY